MHRWVWEHLVGDKRGKYPREAALLSQGVLEIDGAPADVRSEDLEPQGLVDLSQGFRCCPMRLKQHC